MLGLEHQHGSACCTHLCIRNARVIRLLISVEAYTEEASPWLSCLLILRWEWESAFPVIRLLVAPFGDPVALIIGNCSSSSVHSRVSKEKRQTG